jgi:hypothetical protein
LTCGRGSARMHPPLLVFVLLLLCLLPSATTRAAGVRLDRGSAAVPSRTVVPVPAFPSAIAVGSGSVWTLAGGRLVRINPKTNKVVARIDLGVRVGSERSCDLAVAGGVVWTVGGMNATRSDVFRVDALTGRMLGSTQLPFATCVAATTRAAWVTLSNARTLVELNPHGQVLKRVPTYAYCDAIVAGHGAFWAGCPQETAGAPVGRNTGTVLRVTNQGKLSTVGHHLLPGALAAGPAGVFASGVNHDSGTTVRVDSNGVHFLSSGAVAVGRSLLWTVDWRGPGVPGFLRQRDVRTGKILRTFHAGISPVGIALGEGAVWITDYAQPGSVVRIAP